MPSLPVAGVWNREWEEDPLGDSQGADRETLVLWTQARDSGIYVDLRLPLGSPGRSVEAARSVGIHPRPSALTATSMGQQDKLIGAKNLLNLLLEQKSFAGVIQYSVGDTTSGVYTYEMYWCLVAFSYKVTHSPSSSCS
jgi:hypothetical protein